MAVAQPVVQPQPQVAYAQPVGQAACGYGQVAYGQPAHPPPMVVQPIAAAPPPHVVVVNGSPASSGAPPGALEGGTWVPEPFCGDATLVATILAAIIFWPALCCIPCCKCDSRLIYIAPDGSRHLPHGGPVPRDPCQC